MTGPEDTTLQTHEVDDAIGHSGLLASVACPSDLTQLREVIEVLVHAGFGGITLCLPTLRTLAALSRLRTVFEPEAVIGVGNVVSADEAEAAFDAGARYLSSSTVAPDVLATARIAQLPVYSGAFSPTEILNAAQSHADAIRLMPANILGPDYLSIIQHRIPAARRLIPAGGIALTDIEAWISAGAWAVELDTSLFHQTRLNDSIDIASLSHRAALAAQAVADTRLMTDTSQSSRAAKNTAQ